ncbi:rod shape-determining protein MreC [Evansella cellulosilytica]|uniref:Cell shape-determining protein MreC n=1 Tax=Evansella cellulosilytica (strain ATCC 21833 / DSM 2522 / FERM P-1141 / JCM 9156 / N-4) TaxID=649639 RepID=E6TYV0_EVAC2|nr:rod shape-determining protein MreC [Evansella cellulosilytica]ADU31285.1 rod shape-determining protein MreC [Evansella cellulosilytica DSM 2522]
MQSFFSNKRLIVLLVCIIILVALIGYSMSERRSSSWPEQFISDSVGWVQSAFSKPAHFVAGFFENVNDMRNIYEENQILKSHLDEYASLQVELNDLRRQNEELKSSLDLQEGDLYSYSVRNAMVIHRTPDRWNDFIGINKGTQHGIEKDMAVMTSQGLIGKVNQVSQFTATIQLLSDPDRSNRISVTVDSEEQSINGFIEGIDVETGYLQFTMIDIGAELEEGQFVVTSGLGGVFPEGLPIGEIVSFETDEFALTQTAFVKPSASFQRLDYVMIIERGAPSLDITIDPDYDGVLPEEDEEDEDDEEEDNEGEES